MILAASLIAGALGAFLASFAGVIAERFHTGDSWTRGRSRCNSCNRILNGVDLMPIVSWLLARGRCRTCKASIPYRYTLTEAAVAILYFAGMQAYGISTAFLFYAVSVFLLAVIVLYDLRHTLVPIEAAAGLLVSSLAFTLASVHDMHEASGILIIALATGLGFLLLHLVSGGKWMGLGDAPVAFSLSLLAGQHALAGLLFSFWIGGFIGVVILVLAPKGHRMGIEVPFVPFLAAGYLLALFTQWNPLPL